jgi:hemolysin activation/secretion protein
MTARTITTCRLRWALLCVAAFGAPALAQPGAATVERRVEVSGFSLSGATLIDPAVLLAALERFKGRRSLPELREATQAIQNLYVEAGYGAVVAYLPSQAIEDGTIAITVLEGKVGAVVVQGARRKTPAQIRAALPTLREGETPRVRRIDGELQMANENPGRTVGVLLGPGQNPGEVQATVKVQEGAPQRWQLSLDNSGNRRTGEYRASLGWQHTDLTGRDDVLTAQLQTSPTATDAVAVTSLGYRFVFPHWLSALDVYAAYNDVDGGTSPTLAGDLSFSGRGRIVGGRWT